MINLPVGDISLLARSQYGQTKPGLGFHELRTTSVPLPPLDCQKWFSQQVKKLRVLRQHQIKRQRQLENLWDTVLYTAFSANLTAKWREAHLKELLTEMGTQAEALQVKDVHDTDRQLSLFP